MSGECVISSVLFCHNKNLKRRTGVTALGRAGVTAPSYSSVLLENKGKYILKAGRLADPKDTKRRETESEPWPFGSSFYMFFLLPLSLPYVNWASQERCLFYLRSSLRSSDLPLIYFRSLCPSLSFSHRHSGLLFPILPT